jgi:hypothetical protein
MANLKISELAVAGALTGAELIETVQGGVNKQTTTQDIANLGGGGGGLDGHVVEDEGTPFTQRAKLNFVGAGVTVTDDSGDGATVVTIPGSGDVFIETEDVTGTTYNFVAGDHSKVKRFTNAAGCTATIPTGLTIGWLTNIYRAEGAGTLTIASAGSLESIGTQLTEEKTMATIFVRDTDIHVAVGAFGTSGGGHVIEDEGTPLTQRTKLNFVGAGVAVTDDSGDDASVVTINGTSYTAATFGDFIVALAAKATPIDADSIVISDSADSGDAKEVTLAQFKAAYIPKIFQFAASHETTPITAGDDKIKLRVPYAMTVTEVRASLSTAQASGSTFTVDIEKNGTTILSTLITIDNGDTTSEGATTPPVVSVTSIADDDEITVNVDQIGNGTAAGLKIAIIGY